MNVALTHAELRSDIADYGDKTLVSAYRSV